MHIPKVNFTRLHIVRRSNYVSILKSQGTKVQIRTEPLPEPLNDNKRTHNTLIINYCSGCFHLNCVLRSLVSSCELTWLLKIRSSV